MLSIDFIMKSFGVSREAAEKRKKTLARTTYEWRTRSETEYDDIILLKYNSLINKITPKRTMYYWDDEIEIQVQRDAWLDERARWR